MHVAGFLGAGLARKNPCQRRIALSQAVEGGDDVVEGFEVIHAVGAAAEFAGSLRAAQQEHADDCDLAAVEVEDFLQAVFELGDAAVGAAGRAGEALFLQRGQGVANGGFVERHDRVAIVFLVAGVDQGVERERVVVGRGDVFFDQRAEDAGFDFGEVSMSDLLSLKVQRCYHHTGTRGNTEDKIKSPRLAKAARRWGTLV